MKKHVFSIMVVSLTLAILWSAFARAEETGARRRPERPAADRPTARGVRPPAAGAETPRTREMQALSPDQRVKMRERWQNMSPQEREKFRAEIRERFGAARGPAGRTDAPRVFEQQIEQLKKEQTQAIAELREILGLARSEKAAKTARSLEALIAKRQKEFEDRLQALEQRRRRLQATRTDRPDPRGDVPPRPGAKKAPDFKLKDFDGNDVSLAGLKGKTVVLEWMNFECPFSIYHYQTKPTMVSLAKKHKDKNVVWFAVNSTNHTKPDANLAFAEKNKLPFPILNDIPGKVGKAYGAKTTPHIFIIDKAGWIVYDGAIDNAPMGKIVLGKQYVNYASEALDALVAGRSVTTPQTKPYGCTVKYPK